MELAKYQFRLDNKNIGEPRNWSDISLNLTFDENPQASIDVDELEFVNAEAQLLQTHLEGGLTGVTNGYFEGVGLDILATNSTDSLKVFEGFINFKETQINSPVSTSAKIQLNDSINSLQERAEANTFGYLEDIKSITKNDYTQIPYIVEKLDVSTEIVVSSLALYVIIKETAEAVHRLKTALSTAAGLFAVTPGGTIYSLVFVLLQIFVELAYLTFMVIALVDLLETLTELLYPRQRYMAGMLYRTMLEKASTHLGYVFKSDITELDYVHYCPSLPYDETNIDSGIPRVNDFGYNISDFFSLVSDMFNAKFGIVGAELHLRTESDPFWEKTSTFKMHTPEPLNEVKNYNVNDLKTSILISFADDLSDEYTINNFTGTNFQVLTKLKNPKNKKFDLVKGAEQVQMPVALANRKDEKTLLQEVIEGLVDLADLFFAPVRVSYNWIDSLGGDPDPIPTLSSAIAFKIGSMKVSNNTFNVPKAVYLENGLIPIDHRTKFKAKVLWDKYHNEKSFIQNDFRAQKRLYNQIQIPFGFTDALKVAKNSYFQQKNGIFGKITSLKWKFSEDTAVIDYWIREKYDTQSLKEIEIEP